MFVAAKRFYWNSGMFFWRADVFLHALRRYLPKTAALLASLPAFPDGQFSGRLNEVYPLTDNISVDYAILERADNVMGLPVDDIGWNDLGSWNAIHELLAQDENRNVLRSDTLLVNSAGNYVDVPGKLIALVGVKDLIVVDTPDALLIADRAHAQAVGKVPNIFGERAKGLHLVIA